jgi:hypothetical protein
MHFIKCRLVLRPQLVRAERPVIDLDGELMGEPLRLEARLNVFIIGFAVISVDLRVGGAG